VQLKPHGNSKSSMPFFRTSTSAKKLHRELASKSMPKDVVHQATQLQGGELEVRGIGSLPRNRQQIANYRRGDNKKDENVLYSVMLECKQAQGSKEAFVRDVKAAPDPQCVLCYDWQLSDMERFLANTFDEHGVLSIDPTYNLGQFDVTPTTYPHLLLEDVSTCKHPSVLGPILVHQRVNFSAFHYFASSLIGLNKNTRGLRAFGTDGQEPLIDAFSHSFPSAVQLRCFIHFKRNISEKLREYGIPSSVAEEFLADIFGKHEGSSYYAGLVDSVSVSQFHERLDKCQGV